MQKAASQKETLPLKAGLHSLPALLRRESKHGAYLKTLTFRTGRLVKEERGFTFIEIAIFIAILGSIAALAYPYFQEWREKARESATKSNINAIKAAISIYYGDHEGIWPTTLDVSDKTPGYGFGDYLPVMPKVLVTYPEDPENSPAGNEITYKSFTEEPSLTKPDSPGKGWRYDGPEQSNTGRIWVNNSHKDTTGVSYTTYGYQ